MRKADMNQEFERQLPYSQDAEIGVLAAMLMNPEAIDTAIIELREDDFFNEAYCKLFRAIIAVHSDGKPVDPVTLSEQLKKDKTLEEIGGLQFIYEVSGAVPTAANVAFHAGIVREKSVARKLITECTNIIQKAYEPDGEGKLLDSAESGIMTIRDNRTGSYVHVKDRQDAVIRELDKRAAEGIKTLGIPTGFYDLDKIMGGMQDTDLIIVAGRPGMGKTAFALSVAVSVASIGIHHQRVVPVGIFSLEMGVDQLIQRLDCMVGEINLHHFRTATLTENDWSSLNLAANEIHRMPIFINDSAELTIIELRAIARRMKKKEGIGLVIVDYLQLLHAGRRIDSREREVAFISGSLKAMAKELDIPVLGLSQLNRGAESRMDQTPRLADLRESGAIEQDADQVIFVYRPEVAGIQKRDGLSTSGAADVILAKNRNGPTGIVDLVFVKEHTKFKNAEK